jgi:hypothetical protein
VLELDLHTHTRFFHSFRERATPYDPIGASLNGRIAARRGLDGLAVTNHDYSTDVECAKVATIPGIEISTTDGHVLVIGPDPPSATNTGELTPEEAVSLAHDRGCAAIIAHPYRNSAVRTSDAPFDAIEVNGKHPRTREWVERLARQRGLPVVGGSDAHLPVEIGRAHTAIDADEPTPEAVVSAIRDGRVSARVDNWAPHRLLRRFYRSLHSSRDQLQTPEWV